MTRRGFGAIPGSPVLRLERESAPWDPRLGHPCQTLVQRHVPQAPRWGRSLSHGKDAAGCAKGETHIPEAQACECPLWHPKAKQLLVFTVITGT